MRKPGYYWVRFKTNFDDEWVIAEYTRGYYYIVGDSEPFMISDFHEIGPKIERNF